MAITLIFDFLPKRIYLSVNMPNTTLRKFNDFYKMLDRNGTLSSKTSSI